MKKLTALAESLNGVPLSVMSPEERIVWVKGHGLLFDLDWPSNHINYKMCERAMQELVPQYEGHQSWRDYQRQWAAEDQK